MEISNNINQMELYRNTSFGSERTDKASVMQLKQGENTILENNKLNIITALNNLSLISDRNNIEFLLDIADNLNYGEFGNKTFKEELNRDGITPANRENTNWTELLQNTINKAISNSTQNVDDLQKKAEEIFSEDKNLTIEQKEILELRKELTGFLTDKKNLNTDEDIENSARARKNLDYFTASSEISAKEKQECLKKLIYFMSDEYEINPQIKEKKLQVVDEMLNDLVVKTPENVELTIKSTDQRVTGICAAISVCRKAMAYEHKSGFIDIITEELKNSPTMKVYDITELGSGKKVEVPKTEVDYNAALNKGYRIIDASAHIWMNNAHSSGDGTIQTEHYVPFDDNNYGIYDDSSWYLGLDDKHYDEKKLLSALIKEKEFISSALKTKNSIKEIQNNVTALKANAISKKSKANATLNKELSEIFPNKSNSDISKITRNLTDFYIDKTEDNKINISDKMSDEMRRRKTAEFLYQYSVNESDEQKELINSRIKNIDYALLDYNEADEQLKTLQKFNTPQSKFIYYKKLYKSAAAHRLAIEADVNLPDGIIRYEKYAGLPNRSRQITNYLNKISEQTSDKEAIKDSINIEMNIPVQINNILKTLTDKNMQEIASEILSHQKKLILSGDENTLANMSEKLDINQNDKSKTVKKLDKILEKISSNPSQNDVNEVIRLLGYENEIAFADTIINAVIHSFEAGIGEEDYKRLSDVFGGENRINMGVIKNYNKFTHIKKDYNNIVEKWNIPSSRELILEKLEKNNTVLSRKTLDELKNHFNKIENEHAKNEKISNMKKRAKADNELYKFSNDELSVFQRIENNLSSMKRYSNMQYRNLNKILFNELENQYSAIGMLNGQFWVLEEGSSGLMSNEKLRIMEQMTGEPCHIERDINEAVKQIKEGKGSGVIAMSVDDSDYAFHAMYLPAVTEETFTKEDGTQEIEDVLWMDNSWGKAEKEHYWVGQDGYKYTDYDRGFGWKDGFLLRDNLTIGLPVKEIFGAKGIASEDKDEFGLFKDIILKGVPSKTNHKLDKMFEYIFRVHEGETQLEAIEKLLQDGAKIDINFVQQVDNLAEAKSQELEKRIRKEIKCEDDFNNLPDDDPIKFTFEKLSLYLGLENADDADDVLSITTKKDLDEFRNNAIANYINTMGAIIGKYEDCIDDITNASSNDILVLLNEINEKYKLNFSETDKIKFLSEMYRDDEKLDKLDGNIDNLEKYLMEQISLTAEKYIKNSEAKEYFIEKTKEKISDVFDEEIRITSLESNAIKNNALGKEFIAVVDKYFEPSTDEELLVRLQEFQHVDNNTAKEFFELLSEEELGFRIKKPYEYLQLFLSDNTAVNKAFSEVVQMEEINKLMYPDSNEEQNKPETLYRNLHVKLSEMDVQKYIKTFKSEAFEKYKVRQAFPQPIVVNDAEINNLVELTLDKIKESVDNIEKNNYLLDILGKYDKLLEICNNKEFKKLLKNKHIDLNDTNAEEVQKFKLVLNDLYEAVKDDESIDYIAAPIKELKDVVEGKDDAIDTKTLNKYLKEVIEHFDDFNSSGVNIKKLTELNQIERNAIKEVIHACVYSNVEPKYQDEAIKQIKNIINLYRKDEQNKDIEPMEEQLSDLITQRHYLKNPTVLLKEYIKSVQEGKSQDNVTQNMREYLLLALSVAEQTQVQYKLVQNQHEAISSKTKSKLADFEICVEDGSKHKISSEMGMIYLIQQLRNYSDNNVILKLFLSQAGLNKQAVSVLIKNTNIEKTQELIDDNFKDIRNSIENAQKISDEAAKFLNQSKIEYKSSADAVAHFQRYMKNHLEEIKESDSYKIFFEHMDYFQQNTEGKCKNQELYTSILVEVVKSALMNVADSIETKMENVNDISKSLYERQQLINSLEIPKDCEEYNEREEYNQKFSEIYQVIDKKSKEISEQFENSSVFSAEE